MALAVIAGIGIRGRLAGLAVGVASVDVLGAQASCHARHDGDNHGRRFPCNSRCNPVLIGEHVCGNTGNHLASFPTVRHIPRSRVSVETDRPIR